MRKRTQITLVAVAKARISLVHCTLLTHRLVVFRVYGFIDWSVSISRKFDVGNSRLIFEHFFDCWHLSKNHLWNGSKKEKNWLYAVQTCLICCSKALNLIWYLAKSVWHSRDLDRQRTREREKKNYMKGSIHVSNFNALMRTGADVFVCFSNKHILSFPRRSSRHTKYT